MIKELEAENAKFPEIVVRRLTDLPKVIRQKQRKRRNRK